MKINSNEFIFKFKLLIVYLLFINHNLVTEPLRDLNFTLLLSWRFLYVNESVYSFKVVKLVLGYLQIVFIDRFNFLLKHSSY